MSTDVLFDHALDAAVDAVEAAGVPLGGCEATLIRDLRGRLRLHVAGPAGHRWPEDAKRKLKAALAGIAPYGTEVVYLEAGGAVSKDFPLAAILQRERVALAPLPGAGARVAAWFKLERRFSKDAWLTELRTPQEPWPFGSGPPVISFYGFKGGVGRTTALAAFALHLAERLSKNVVVIDLDLEAPGIGSLLLGADVEPDLGVVDFLLEERSGRATPLALSRFYVGSPHVAGAGTVRVVPAGRLDENYLEKLGRVDVQGLVEPGRPIREPLLALLARIRDEVHPDAILLDVRAGLHDLGGVSLSGLSHLELIFAVHSPQTWAGLPIVLRHLGYLRAEWIKLVHAMVPPATRGGDALHEAFVAKAYEVCSETYYEENKVPDRLEEEAPHAAYRLPHREAVMAISDLHASKSDLLADEHKAFCDRLAADVGLSG